MLSFAVCPQFSNFLSDIGGTLGLWMGMSIFTMVEFLELGVDILVLGGKMGLVARVCHRKITHVMPAPDTPPPPYAENSPSQSVSTFTCQKA